jgi:DNA topoisomerase-1
MAATLVIVESPGKIKKLSAILGDGYRVVASVGHVRDLPSNSMGFEPPAFRPTYVPTDRGRDVIAKLKVAVAAATHVLLATDPDREGEAIAWHLADTLRLRNAKRITFTEITAPAVRAAIATPRAIDMDRVHAQEARRVLDRLVGYRVSPALSDKAGSKLTAGRVQSPAVRLVVDREREIRAFRATEHYGAELTFAGLAGNWKAVWQTKAHLAPGQDYLLDDALAARVSCVRNVTVTALENSETGQAPKAPFITSSLQQVAGARLKFKPKKVMDLAQKLYEQGVISYHRTDSLNLSVECMDDIAGYAAGHGLALASPRRTWKAREGAQEGHEAIRPTHASDVDAGETADEKALYRLIWARAIASQLADARYAVRTATLAGKAGDTAVTFLAKGRTLISAGWQTVYVDPQEDDGKDGELDENANPVPALAIGQAEVALSGKLLTKTTKAPSRFKEPTLVGELERLGIGRPSTYAAILENISIRGYISEDGKGFLSPSPSGEAIRDALVGRFKFADLEYTRSLEGQLDQIAGRHTGYHAVVAGAWDLLTTELQALGMSTLKVINVAAVRCPTCNAGELRRIKGSNGFFWGCSRYRDGCKASFDDARGKPQLVARSAAPKKRAAAKPKARRA